MNLISDKQLAAAESFRRIVFHNMELAARASSLHTKKQPGRKLAVSEAVFIPFIFGQLVVF